MDAAPQKIRVMLVKVKIQNPQKIRAVMFFFVKIPNPQKIGAVMVLGDGPDGRHTPRTVQWPWTHPPPSQSLYQLTLMRTQRWKNEHEHGGKKGQENCNITTNNTKNILFIRGAELAKRQLSKLWIKFNAGNGYAIENFSQNYHLQIPSHKHHCVNPSDPTRRPTYQTQHSMILSPLLTKKDR